MIQSVIASAQAAVLLSPIPAWAQTGEGSPRGYVKNEQGGVLPGVTATATSTAVMAPVVAVTESAGYYRLNNPPPSTYVLTGSRQP